MWHSIGYIQVAAAGTPTAVSATRVACQTVFFQQAPTNTGLLYVCDRANANKTTGVGILAIIPAPTLNAGSVASALPYAAVTIPSAIGALSIDQFWVDADVSGNSCLVSYVRP